MGKVGVMSKQDLEGYMGMVQKQATIWRAELVLNPFDLNAMHNLNLLDHMVVEVLNRYLNEKSD